MFSAVADERMGEDALSCPEIHGALHPVPSPGNKRLLKCNPPGLPDVHDDHASAGAECEEAPTSFNREKGEVFLQICSVAVKIYTTLYRREIDATDPVQRVS